MEAMAKWFHKDRCEKCDKVTGTLEQCPEKHHWTSYATTRLERRQKASVANFGFGKPREVTLLERRMKMGAQAKEVKDCLDQYIKGLIDNNLTLDQVSELYDKMMDLASMNRKYKNSVCPKKPKKKRTK